MEDCIEAAGLLHDPSHQKQLMRAAQFGKSFLPPGGLGVGAGSADAFSTMCKTLRVLNAVRNYRVGMPLTITQYRFVDISWVCLNGINLTLPGTTN